MALTQYSTSGENQITYTIGLFGVAGCDYNFTAPANTTQQSIQLGGTTIVPANATVPSIVPKCVASVVGGTTTINIGSTSGAGDYIGSIVLSTINDITSASTVLVASSSATSIYFSITPSVNWSLLTLGKWKISITRLTNSQL